MLCVFPALAQPVADHHQHLFRSAVAPAPGLALTAKDLIAQLDEAGIQKAAIFSIAYQFGNPNRPAVENEQARVRAENLWTLAQAAEYPKRLVAFCSVNPLKDYALPEIASWSKAAAGLKLHFGNSDVDLENADHVVKLRDVFKLANRKRLAIVVHLRSTVSRKRPWGARQAQAFLDYVLPAAPDVPIQIAHMAGAGGYGDPGVDPALGVFVEAAARKDRRMSKVWIEVSGVFMGNWEPHADRIAQRLRALGMKRILYGSDMPPSGAWKAFRKLPLAPAEFRIVETNVAPYLRN